jgi:hypothetical protein
VGANRNESEARYGKLNVKPGRKKTASRGGCGRVKGAIVGGTVGCYPMCPFVRARGVRAGAVAERMCRHQTRRCDVIGERVTSPASASTCAIPERSASARSSSHRWFANSSSRASCLARPVHRKWWCARSSNIRTPNKNKRHLGFSFTPSHESTTCYT